MEQMQQQQEQQSGIDNQHPQLCSIGQVSSDEQAIDNQRGSEESQQKTRSAMEYPNLVQQCTEPSEGGAQKQESQQDSAVSQYFVPEEDYIIDEEALPTDLIIVDPTNSETVRGADHSYVDAQSDNKSEQQATMMPLVVGQQPLEMIQELHEKSKITYGEEEDEESIMLHPLKVSPPIKQLTQQKSSPSQERTTTPIFQDELENGNSSIRQAVEEMVQQRQASQLSRQSNNGRDLATPTQRVSALHSQEMDSVATKITEKQRLDEVFVQHNVSPILHQDSIVDSISVPDRYESLENSDHTSIEGAYQPPPAAQVTIKDVAPVENSLVYEASEYGGVEVLARSREHINADLNITQQTQQISSNVQETQQTMSIREFREISAQKPVIPQSKVRYSLQPRGRSTNNGTRFSPERMTLETESIKMPLRTSHGAYSVMNGRPGVPPQFVGPANQKRLGFQLIHKRKQVGEKKAEKQRSEKNDPQQHDDSVKMRDSNNLYDSWFMKGFKQFTPRDELSSFGSDSFADKTKLSNRYLLVDQPQPADDQPAASKQQSRGVGKRGPQNKREKRVFTSQNPKSGPRRKLQVMEAARKQRASQNRPLRDSLQDPRDSIFPSKGNYLLRSQSKDAAIRQIGTSTPVVAHGNWEPRHSYGSVVQSDQQEMLLYQQHHGLDSSTIATMPLDALYRRIGCKSNNNFDLKISQALKKSRQNLHQKDSLQQQQSENQQQLGNSQRSPPAAVASYEEVKSRFFQQQLKSRGNSNRSGSRNSKHRVNFQTTCLRKTNVLDKISADFEEYTKLRGAGGYMDDGSQANPISCRTTTRGGGLLSGRQHDLYELMGGDLTKMQTSANGAKPPNSAYGGRPRNTYQDLNGVFAQRGLSIKLIGEKKWQRQTGHYSVASNTAISGGQIDLKLSQATARNARNYCNFLTSSAESRAYTSHNVAAMRGEIGESGGPQGGRSMQMLSKTEDGAQSQLLGQRSHKIQDLLNRVRAQQNNEQIVSGEGPSLIDL